jgi:tetratricopeptide (TPR) repeat protein
MLLILVLAIVALGLGIALFLVFAPGPRRWRTYHRAQTLLKADDWDGALSLVRSLRPDRQSSAWQARLDQLAGECHQHACEDLLKAKEFENALKHATKAAERLDLKVEEEKARVVDAALAEVRRLFASEKADSQTLTAMIARTAKLVGKAPAETTFWEALDLIRQGHMDEAVTRFAALHEEAGKHIIDVPLYLGLLLHRLGKPQEALRYLADANRIDSNCPFVPWQMGISLMASNGDSSLAMRALQRALGTRGFDLWKNQPERLWIEAMPEGRSYVRRLATRHRYVCPLLGGDLSIILRQGQLALAQACYRQERYQEATDLYARLLQNSPPTAMLLRGYGLALARLGQHDQAYKHLRIALEEEEPKDPFTAGYLALCGALGKPTNPEDKPRNIAWALKLLARYPVMGNAEWTNIIGAVCAEARKIAVPLSAEDQVLLCDGLASVGAHDPRAALSYSHLLDSFPEAVKPVYAWLYTRAAATHGVRGKDDLDFFARTFQHAGSARAFFEQQGWDFGEVEYTYLSRCAEQEPGRFPEILGAEYPARGEAFLLARSQAQEQAGHKDPARESIEVLLRLAPKSATAHDRLACLHYRAGNVERSVELLDGWRKLAPGDHWPLVRQAIIEQERGNAGKRAEAIQGALGLTSGAIRAAVAFLGAQLALRESFRQQGPLGPAKVLLEECLREQPDHPDALWCLAAVHASLGDSEALAGLAPQMDQPGVRDARVHFLGAICSLVARDYRRSLLVIERVPRDSLLAVEARFVMGWVRLHLGQPEQAIELFRAVAEQQASPSAVYARALLGRLCHQANQLDESIVWWSGLEPAWRNRWSIDEPLRQTVLLAGLMALEEQRYEQAADRFREAGKLGLRDKRLGGLITVALVKAGQRLLFEV